MSREAKNVRFRSILLMLTLPLLAQVLVAGPILSPVQVSASFTGGALGTWDFTFTSGPANLQLEQITIDLSPTDVKFDTAPGGFGSLTSEDIGGYAGTDVTTGLDNILPGTGAALDGGQLLTFQFNNFTPGDTFNFNADVDHPNPTLIPLPDCSSLSGLAKVACLATRAADTAINNGRLTAAQTVTGQQFNGVLVTYTFGSPSFHTANFTTSYTPDGGLHIFGAQSNLTGDVEAMPEPATFLSFAAGLILLGLRRRRQAR